MTYPDIGTDSKTYHREQYGYQLRVRQRRLHAWTGLESKGKSDDHLVEVMTRWLRRCVRDEPIVVGTAKVTTHVEIGTGWAMLRAIAPAYRDVTDEPDAITLRSLVDDDIGQTVIIGRLSERL